MSTKKKKPRNCIFLSVSSCTNQGPQNDLQYILMLVSGKGAYLTTNAPETNQCSQTT